MNGTIIAVLGVAVVAGIAIYAVQQSKAASAQEAVAAYEQGRAKGAQRTQAEQVGGLIGGLGQLGYGIFG